MEGNRPKMFTALVFKGLGVAGDICLFETEHTFLS
jgi:hypothetical protein